MSNEATTRGFEARNCVFAGNEAENGGAVSTFYAGLLAANCTFTANRASAQFGAVLIQGPGSFLDMTNCLLWDNPDAFGSGMSSQMWFPAQPFSMRLSHNLIEGYDQGTTFGPGNFGADPRFTDGVGADGVPGTGDEDLRPRFGSPALDAGANATTPNDMHPGFELPPVDARGLPRVADSDLDGSADADVGAYELQREPRAPTGAGAPRSATVRAAG